MKRNSDEKVKFKARGEMQKICRVKRRNLKRNGDEKVKFNARGKKG